MTSDISIEVEDILALKKERDAVIVAHNYQPAEIQDLADFVGDSLAMARWAHASSAKTLIVAGVYFMAETAAIVCPDKEVLIPEKDAGCSLAASITAKELLAWKTEHADAVVVSYVNTSAAVKALSDYCCTSSNAVAVVNAIDPKREVLFVPDFFLGAHVIRETGRENIHLWHGECHVHAAIDPDRLTQKMAEYPGAELLIHPECGCTTRALALPPEGVLAHVLSTDGMLAHVKTTDAHRFVVATEVGLLHRLRLENPGKEFIAAEAKALCPFMNLITREKIYWSLKDSTFRVTLDPATRERAWLPLERMLAIR